VFENVFSVEAIERRIPFDLSSDLCSELPAGEFQGRSLMQGDVVGLVTLDLILRLVLARMMDISFVVHIFRMHLDNAAADPPGFRVPGDMIVLFEFLRL
jgi:hypothetical protein